VNYHNEKAFWKYLYKTFFDQKGTNYRLTTKRLGVVLLSLGIYLPVELIVWTGLVLDDLLYPDYLQIPIKEPLFIIGNPRSGTTFLHRLMARDSANFLSMRTWEIFGSPSISMRKVLRGTRRILKEVGFPISKHVRDMESLWQDSDKIHRLRLRDPEEDEYLFIHNFSTLKIWSFASMVSEGRPYIYFDQQIPLEEKERIMGYYRSCVQRHYYYHGRYKKHYLSKNPNFTPAIRTLMDTFQDAKFIYLVRNPLEAVPSHINLKEREWKMLGSPLKPYACKDFIMESSQHWYDYPLQVIDQLPSQQAVIIRFEDLVSDAGKIVQSVYDHFGLEITPAFKGILDRETVLARNHKSQHDYSLEAIGLTLREMQARFGRVMDRFNYSPVI
jgi:hypothetical protein